MRSWMIFVLALGGSMACHKPAETHLKNQNVDREPQQKLEVGESTCAPGQIYTVDAQNPNSPGQCE